MLIKKLLLFILLSLPVIAFGQSPELMMQEIDDDLNPGSDIFSDFNEDLESAQVLEDERFYRYGRFFSVNVGAGLTTFTGNRGLSHTDNPPTFHLSMNYFLDFQKAITLGIEYSKHTMVLDTVVHGYNNLSALGAVVTDMMRVFVGYKYYIDTTDLGTAITYSNPHFIGRLEYWYQTTDFIDQPTLPKANGGGIGTGLGFGLEFPVELKQSYISVEALYHVVNFYDKYTTDYRQAFQASPPAQPNTPVAGSTYGYDDMTGNVMSLVVTYNFTW